MSKLLINEYPLMVLPSLAKNIGLNEAIVLQQIHYWLNPRINKNFKENCYWVYNTYQEWQLQFPFFSLRTIRRIICSLEDTNLLISKQFDKSGNNHTKWYTINYSSIYLNEELNSSKNQNVQTNGQNGQTNGQNGQSQRPKWTYDVATLATSINKETKTTTETTHTLNQNDTKKNSSIYTSEQNERVMIDIWSKIVESSDYEKKLTTNRRLKLARFFKNYFNNDLEKWIDFCKDVKSSDFLMGKVTKFKASLDWVLNEEIIVKIIEGDYGISDNSQNLNNNEEIDISLEIDALSESQEAKFLRKAIVKHIGKAVYVSWFSKICIKLIDKSIHFITPTNFSVVYLIDNYLTSIKQIISNLFSEEREIKIYA